MISTANPGSGSELLVLLYMHFDMLFLMVVFALCLEPWLRSYSRSGGGELWWLEMDGKTSAVWSGLQGGVMGLPISGYGISNMLFLMVALAL